MVQPGAAARLVRQRPAHGVLDEARLELVWRKLPQLLDAETVFLVVAVLVQGEAVDQRLGERAARALTEHRILAAQLHAAGEVVTRLAAARDAEIAGGDADDGTVLVVEHFGGREARIDLDAERLGLGTEIFGQVRERADEVAVVRHELGEEHVRQPQAAGSGEDHELVALNLGLQRAFRVLAPFGQQYVEAGRVDHGARQDVRADLGALLDDDDVDLLTLLGGDLFQPDRGGEAGRSCADDHDVEVHAFAFRQRHPLDPPNRAWARPTSRAKPARAHMLKMSLNPFQTRMASRLW
ncbi:hypothetical protein MMMDOFMJ_1448 [Methylobacterium gnaphalii]|nr:hypothetical protein MMMDOFMJ_1448 [Methylobacterium gnaphalii]